MKLSITVDTNNEEKINEIVEFYKNLTSDQTSVKSHVEVDKCDAKFALGSAAITRELSIKDKVILYLGLLQRGVDDFVSFAIDGKKIKESDGEEKDYKYSKYNKTYPNYKDSDLLWLDDIDDGIDKLDKDDKIAKRARKEIAEFDKLYHDICIPHEYIQTVYDRNNDAYFNSLYICEYNECCCDGVERVYTISFGRDIYFRDILDIPSIRLQVIDNIIVEYRD